ncbi:EAL domain-containing protein, partial [Clostridium sp. Sa3CUN1]
ICIEVIGNINVRDIEIISGNIKILKEAGFLIAIDDFGIEYSNLNIIQDLDIDIIKIDKIFTENMDKSIIRSEIIIFISRIAKAEDKFIVLEGIDKIEQEKKIKEIDNDKLCVQGNLYDEIIK